MDKREFANEQATGAALDWFDNEIRLLESTLAKAKRARQQYIEDRELEAQGKFKNLGYHAEDNCNRVLSSLKALPFNSRPDMLGRIFVQHAKAREA